VIWLLTQCFKLISFLHILHQVFNVSSLLLDNALKPATPLINGAISGVAGLSASSNSKVDTFNI